MKNKQKIWSENRETVIVEGSFAPNGAGAVDATSNKGKGFSVARTGAGTFEITFDEKYVDLISFRHNLQLSAADDKYTQAGDYTAPTVSAAAKIVVRVWDASGAAATDVAANANNHIHFSAIFRMSAVNP